MTSQLTFVNRFSCDNPFRQLCIHGITAYKRPAVKPAVDHPIVDLFSRAVSAQLLPLPNSRIPSRINRPVGLYTTLKPGISFRQDAQELLLYLLVSCEVVVTARVEQSNSVIAAIVTTFLRVETGWILQTDALTDVTL